MTSLHGNGRRLSPRRGLLPGAFGPVSEDRAGFRRRTCITRIIPPIALILTCAAAHGETKPRKSIEAYRLSGESVVIDGVLDEPAWARAAVGSRFVERSPSPGAKPPADSRFRIVYDDEALIMGIEMGLLEGEQPVARTLSRESPRIWDDDAVTVKLDVRFQQRNAVGFAVNVAGATIDILAIDNGRIFRSEFDTVWEAKTSVRADAWVAEIRIPYAAMGLPKRPGPQTLGLNISRDHNKRRATDDWSETPAGFGPGSTIHFGQVTLTDVGAPTTLSILPYLTLVHPGDGAMLASGPIGASAGGDLRLRLGEDVWSELTFLTDFAEVDLDAAVLNFGRFPLFLPEKRQFFLTGLDVFAFGRPRNTQVFFSRRVGLDDDGNEVPIIGGGKLYGRAGKLAFGLLEVFTAETNENPATSFTVGRAYHEMGTLRLGSIVAMRTRFDPKPPPPPDPPMPPAGSMMMPMMPMMAPGEPPPSPASKVDHVAVGVDGSLRLLESRLTMSSFGATTFDLTPRGGPGDDDALVGHAGSLVINWRGEVFRPSLKLGSTHGGFDPKMGFVRRTDVSHGTLSLEWDWRWSEGFVERVYFEGYGGGLRSADLDASLGHNVGSNLSITARNGLMLTASAEHLVDVVTDPYDLFGVTVAPGDHARTGGFVGLGNPPQQNPRVFGFVGAARGPNGEGDHTIGANTTISLGPHFRFNGFLSYTRLLLLEDVTGAVVPLDTVRGNAGLVMAVSPDLSADLVVQGTTATTDDERLAPWHDIAGNALLRIRWRYLPGSDLFVVYRQPFDLHRDGSPEDLRLTVKLSYWYDIGL